MRGKGKRRQGQHHRLARAYLARGHPRTLGRTPFCSQGHQGHRPRGGRRVRGEWGAKRQPWLLKLGPSTLSVSWESELKPLKVRSSSIDDQRCLGRWAVGDGHPDYPNAITAKA